jgi:imidazole glycerol phosphate synthase glutamine amidotransferase subunit
MKKIRIIPRLDIKGPNVIKGIHLEGLRIVGQPAKLARKYYEQGADEIIYIDVVASLYGRNNILEIIKETTSLGVFIPITVGGGIRTIEDIKQVLRAGADKVAINTAAIKNPKLIKEASEMFGTQCIVGLIEAKRNKNSWEAYIENGREKTGIDAIKWAKKLVELGAGEILVTSIDQEGTKKGYELELIKKIVNSVNVPVIACGGAGSINHIEDCLLETKCDAISLASILHYNLTTIDKIKEDLSKKKFNVRLDGLIKQNKKSIEKNRKTVSIIDYGLGNLRSVASGFNEVGNPIKIISTPEEILNAELLVLPGVGAFEDGMIGLKKRGLIEPLKKYAIQGKPLLGICLGAQLFLEESSEFGSHKGLGIIKGSVVKFLDPKKQDKTYRVPHMGWNNLIIPKESIKKDKFLSNILKDKDVYFVHSFYPLLSNNEFVLAKSSYGGQEFCAIFKKGNIFGCQFHPEKSGEIGLKIIDYFGSL